MPQGPYPVKAISQSLEDQLGCRQETGINMNASKPALTHKPGPLARPRPNFKVHPSVLRYTLPLSKFSRLPSNAGKQIWVGLIMVEKGTAVPAAATDDLDGPKVGVIGEGKRKHEPTALLVRSSSNSKSIIPVSKLESDSCSEPTHPDPGSHLTDGTPTQSDSPDPFPSLTHRNDFQLPSLAAQFGTDQCLLECVNRCALYWTGKGVREITRFLGSAEYDYDSILPISSTHPGAGVQLRISPTHPGLPLGMDSGADGTQGEKKQDKLQVKRFDFLVQLHRGPVVLPPGSEGKWVRTDESWRVMKGLPAGAVEDEEIGGEDEDANEQTQAWR